MVIELLYSILYGITSSMEYKDKLLTESHFSIQSKGGRTTKGKIKRVGSKIIVNFKDCDL